MPKDKDELLKEIKDLEQQLLNASGDDSAKVINWPIENARAKKPQNHWERQAGSAIAIANAPRIRPKGRTVENSPLQRQKDFQQQQLQREQTRAEMQAQNARRVELNEGQGRNINREEYLRRKYERSLLENRRHR